MARRPAWVYRDRSPRRVAAQRGAGRARAGCGTGQVSGPASGLGGRNGAKRATCGRSGGDVGVRRGRGGRAERVLRAGAAATARSRSRSPHLRRRRLRLLRRPRPRPPRRRRAQLSVSPNPLNLTAERTASPPEDAKTVTIRNTGGTASRADRRRRPCSVLDDPNHGDTATGSSRTQPALPGPAARARRDLHASPSSSKWRAYANRLVDGRFRRTGDTRERRARAGERAT